LALSSFLKCIFNVLSSSFALKIQLFYLDNLSVTSKMVSRFICRRLAQGYSFREVINPLLSELKKVAKLTKAKISSFGKVLKKDSTFREDLLKFFLAKFFFIFKKNFINFFKLMSTWMNCTLFSFFFWFQNLYLKESAVLIGFSRIFFKRLPSFLIFFDYSSFLRSKNFYKSFNDFFLPFFSTFNFSIFFFKTFDYLFSNGSVILDLEKVMHVNFNELLICNLHYNRFLRFKLWTNVMQHVLQLNNINNRKIRQNFFRNHYPSSIMGYKLHCCGRFSRKQIASSLWFNFGNVPLNTISAKIDYGFNTIPLHNSLVSIKVWIYKSRLSSTWFFKQV
jgi:ribosomal protein S3